MQQHLSVDIPGIMFLTNKFCHTLSWRLYFSIESKTFPPYPNPKNV